MSLLSIVTSSSAFRLPASPPPKGSSIDSDWSTKNKKQPGFLRLISAWYAMVVLHSSWHHENEDSHMPEVTGWSPVATIPRMQRNVSVNPSPDLNQGWRGRVGASPERGCTIANSPEEFHDSAAISATTCRRRGLRSSSGRTSWNTTSAPVAAKCRPTPHGLATRPAPRLHCTKCNVGLMAILLRLDVMDLRAM